jgi:hypothetical protein
VLYKIIKILIAFILTFIQASNGQSGKIVPYQSFKIDSLTALKISRDSGLTNSIYPIRAGLLESSDGTYSWRIVTTTWKDSLNATGRTFWINANTGRIIENGIWNAHFDITIPVNKK